MLWHPDVLDFALPQRKCLTRQIDLTCACRVSGCLRHNATMQDQETSCRSGHLEQSHAATSTLLCARQSQTALNTKALLEL